MIEVAPWAETAVKTPGTVMHADPFRTLAFANSPSHQRLRLAVHVERVLGCVPHQSRPAFLNTVSVRSERLLPIREGTPVLESALPSRPENRDH